MAVIGQEEGSGSKTTRRVVFVEVVSPLKPTGRKTERERFFQLFLLFPTRKILQTTRTYENACLGSVFNKHVRTDHKPCPKLTAIKIRVGKFLFLQIILS